MSVRVHDAAQEWQRERRRPELLWRGALLTELEEWLHDPSGKLTPLDHEFTDASRDLAYREPEERRLRKARVRLTIAGLAIALAGAGLGAWDWRNVERAHDAQAISEAKRATAETTAELEQGRAAGLHGDLAEAQQHLGEAWRRGERSSATEFMLARALEPRLAELASLSPISGRMWSVAWSPDGNQLATADDGGVQVWDARSHQRVVSLPGDRVYSAVYSADGARLTTSAWDGVRIWNAATGSLVHELRNGARPKHYFTGATTRDGRLVAALSTTGDATDVWDTATGKLLAEIHNDVAPTRRAITFSADGRWLATSSGDHLQLVDTATWRPVTIAVRHVLGLSFDPIRRRIATATGDGCAAIWSLPDGALVRRLRESGEPIEQITWSPDGHLLATASRDGAEQVWDARSGALVSQGNYLHDSLSSMEFDSSSRLVLAVGKGIVVSDAAQGLPITTFDAPQRVAHFSPTAQRIAAASTEGPAHVWDARSSYRRWASTPIADSCGTLGGIAPDSRFLAVACPDHATRVWDTARDELLAELPSVSAPGGDFALVFPAVSAAGDRVAVAHGKTAEVYELPGGRLIGAIAHGAAVTAVAFGPGGELVSGDAAGVVLVTRDRQAQPMPPARGGIDAMAMLANGQILIADSSPHLRVLDQEGTAITNIEMPVRAGLLRPSPDAHRLVVIPSSTVGQPGGTIRPGRLFSDRLRR